MPDSVSSAAAYARRNGWRWVLWYFQQRRFLAGARQAWWAYVRGHDGECCEFCGQPYPLWHAPDDLWGDLMGGPGGLCCIRCFDWLARRRGLWLRWRPEVA